MVPRAEAGLGNCRGNSPSVITQGGVTWGNIKVGVRGVVFKMWLGCGAREVQGTKSTIRLIDYSANRLLFVYYSTITGLLLDYYSTIIRLLFGYYWTIIRLLFDYYSAIIGLLLVYYSTITRLLFVYYSTVTRLLLDYYSTIIRLLIDY